MITRKTYFIPLKKGVKLEDFGVGTERGYNGFRIQGYTKIEAIELAKEMSAINMNLGAWDFNKIKVLK